MEVVKPTISEDELKQFKGAHMALNLAGINVNLHGTILAVRVLEAYDEHGEELSIGHVAEIQAELSEIAKGQADESK